MTELQKCLLDLVRAVVLEQELPGDFTLTDLKELYEFSKSHDMAHLVAYGLKKNDLIDVNSELGKLFEKQHRLAQYRVASLQAEYESICFTLEDAGIDYIPLKGSVLRSLYLQDWMRVSCDIDILVRLEEFEKAKKALVDQLGYVVAIEGEHNHQLDAPNGFHVELHFILTEKETAARAFFDNVWNYVTPENDTPHRYLMNDEMFYLFHIFHAAAHLKRGGCGVRTFLDTWLLNHRVPFDKQKRQELLEKSDLSKAADAFEIIAEKWFSGAANDDYQLLEDFIFSGGVYGGLNYQMRKQINSGGSKARYYFTRIFPHVDDMHKRYPVLNERPYLLPAYWVKRWFSVTKRSTSSRIRSEVTYVDSEMDSARKMLNIFEELGI